MVTGGVVVGGGVAGGGSGCDEQPTARVQSKSHVPATTFPEDDDAMPREVQEECHAGLNVATQRFMLRS
jgi:hypothetical protein